MLHVRSEAISAMSAMCLDGDGQLVLRMYAAKILESSHWDLMTHPVVHGEVLIFICAGREKLGCCGRHECIPCQVKEEPTRVMSAISTQADRSQEARRWPDLRRKLH